MVHTSVDIVQYASIGIPTETDDGAATGTPTGVSALSDGDTVDADVESVGSVPVDVIQRDLSCGDAGVQKRSQNR